MENPITTVATNTLNNDVNSLEHQVKDAHRQIKLLKQVIKKIAKDQEMLVNRLRLLEVVYRDGDSD